MFQRITRSRFIELTDSILELFPHEERDLYYIPSKKVKNLSVNARGSIYNAYNEWRRLLAHAKMLKNCENQENSKESMLKIIYSCLT